MMGANFFLDAEVVWALSASDLQGETVQMPLLARQTMTSNTVLSVPVIPC